MVIKVLFSPHVFQLFIPLIEKLVFIQGLQGKVSYLFILLFALLQKRTNSLVVLCDLRIQADNLFLFKGKIPT